MTDFYTALNTVISKCGANILDTPALCKEELHNAGIEENTLEEQLFFLILDKNIFFEIKKITGNDKEIKNTYDLAIKVYLRLFANEGYSNNREIILIKHIQTIVDVLDDNKLIQIKNYQNKKEVSIIDFEIALKKLIHDYDVTILTTPDKAAAILNDFSGNVLKDVNANFKRFLEKLNQGNFTFQNSKERHYFEILKQVTESLEKTYLPLKKIDNQSSIRNHSLENNTQPVLSPIAGTICRYLVKEGSDVSPDTKILTIECMKMELEIKAGCSGKVHFITPVGSKIKMNQTIATIHKDNQSLQKEYNKHEDLKIRKEEKNRENEKKQPRSLIQNSIDNFLESDLIWGMCFCCPIIMVIYAAIIFWEYLNIYDYLCMGFCFFMIGTICTLLLEYINKFLNWKSIRIINKNSNNIRRLYRIDSIMDRIVFFIFCIARIAIGGIFELIFWLFLPSSLPIDNNIVWIIFPGMAYSALFILIEIIYIIYQKINKNPKVFYIIILAIINVIIIIGIVKLKSQNNGITSISLNNQKLSYIVVGKNEEIKTLKKAIKLIDEGGTIELRPGTYNGNININKNIKLLGIKEDIKTKSSSELPIIKGQCKIKANAEIEGVAFTKSYWEEYNCLLVKSDSRIKNIAILNSAHDGIVFTAKNATLENSIISNCMDNGIRCCGNASPSIINTQINKTNDAGIVLEDNSNPLLMNCKISGSNGYGLVIKNTASGNFSNCIINNSDYSGIVIKSPVKSVFLNCDIFNNGGNGVKISNGPRLKMGTTSRFENCKLYDNKNGILIYNKANPILQDCEIYSNKVYGIWIKNDINGIYPSCFIHDNTVQNIFLVKRNTIQIYNLQSTIKSNNGNTTVVSQEPKKTTLQPEPGGIASTEFILY